MNDRKRKYPRVNYPCAITVWKRDGASEVIMANTANLGAGGMCVYLNETIAPETELDIKIDNFFEANPLKCHGKVVRCREDKSAAAGRQKFYEVGIEFISMDDDMRFYLSGFVERLMDLEGKRKR